MSEIPYSVRGSRTSTLTTSQVTDIARQKTSGVYEIEVLSGGSGYISPPSVNIGSPSQSGGTQAIATANISGGAVISFTISIEGSGYNGTEIVTLTGGGGSGASAIIRTWSDKTISSLTDTFITSLQNDDTLKYNSSTGKWVNGSGGGGTIAARQIWNEVGGYNSLRNLTHNFLYTLAYMDGEDAFKVDYETQAGLVISKANTTTRSPNVPKNGYFKAPTNGIYNISFGFYINLYIQRIDLFIYKESGGVTTTLVAYENGMTAIGSADGESSATPQVFGTFQLLANDEIHFGFRGYTNNTIRTYLNYPSIFIEMFKVN